MPTVPTPSPASLPPSPHPALERILAVGEGAPTADERHALYAALRIGPEVLARSWDRVLLDHTVRVREDLGRAQKGLAQAAEQITALDGIIDELTQDPRHSATFLHLVPALPGRGRPRAEVAYGSVHRVVSIAPDVDHASLRRGDIVLLSAQANAVLEKSPHGASRTGDVARFVRPTPDGRLVISSHGDELVVHPGGALAVGEMQPGDPVRWDRTTFVALERLDRPKKAREHFIEDVPDFGFDRIGGLKKQVRTLLRAFQPMLHPERAASYGLYEKVAVTLIGPPGTGKTTMVRALVSELRRRTGRRFVFASVKPGAFESKWVGETQENIRDLFSALREEIGRDGYALLFLDEVEVIGRTRGSSPVGHHSDKFLGALLAELDGFEDRGRIALVAAGNRRDLIDEALLQRLLDVEIAVGRPGRAAAREIFGIHLPASIPYTGDDPAATRAELIDLAVARLYSPNADAAICTLKLRNDTTREVRASELACGRIFEQISRDARRLAFEREVEGGEPGVSRPDIEEALAVALEKLRTTVTTRNAHALLCDLPSDVDVLRVEPVVRRVARRHLYLNVA